MKKLLISVFSLIVILAVANFAFAADLTNAQLASMIVSLIGIELPPGTENLSAQESFEVMANALATRGINAFVGADKDAAVTYGQFADIIYVMVGGTDTTLDTAGKIQYLVDNGYMGVVDPGTLVLSEDAVRIFDNPVFIGVVADTYSPPAGADFAPMGDAPGVVPENPASQT